MQGSRRAGVESRQKAELKRRSNSAPYFIGVFDAKRKAGRKDDLV